MEKRFPIHRNFENMYENERVLPETKRSSTKCPHGESRESVKNGNANEQNRGSTLKPN